MTSNKYAVWNASLLICGTSIGAGMLALPTATASNGFLPAFVLSFLCWGIMALTGLLLAEACINFGQPHAHFSTITKHYLGRNGQLIGNGLFIFLYYAILIAYYSGASPYFIELSSKVFVSDRGSEFFGMVLFAITMLIILKTGERAITRVNFILMIGLISSFLSLFVVGSPSIKIIRLTYTEWPSVWLAAPVFFGAYGYHNIVPSIVNMLDHRSLAVKYAIGWGTFLTFAVYSCWQFLVVGNLDQGQLLLTKQSHGIPIIEALRGETGFPMISTLAIAFSFFALTTSLLGVSLSMVDFLKDLMPSLAKKTGHTVFCFMVILPPLLTAWVYPNIFVKAFGYASGYGEACLNALFPIAMIALLRLKNKKSQKLVGGGFPLLWILTILTLSVVAIETWQLIF